MKEIDISLEIKYMFYDLLMKLYENSDELPCFCIKTVFQYKKNGYVVIEDGDKVVNDFNYESLGKTQYYATYYGQYDFMGYDAFYTYKYNNCRFYLLFNIESKNDLLKTLSRPFLNF